VCFGRSWNEASSPRWAGRVRVGPSSTGRRPSSWSAWACRPWPTCLPSPRSWPGAMPEQRERSPGPPEPPDPPVPSDAAAPERIQRILARAGLGSRRAAEDLIRQGRVRVDGRVAELGDRADARAAAIAVDGAPVPTDPALRYFALHKPAGVTTTLRDRFAERS